MPKQTVAHYIYEGHMEWLLRIFIKPNGKPEYKQWYLSKKDWTLDQVKIFRNKTCKEYEECGLRDVGPCRRGGRIPADKLGMN